MKPVIDHMRATRHADFLDGGITKECDCDECNLARAYLDLRRNGWEESELGEVPKALPDEKQPTMADFELLVNGVLAKSKNEFYKDGVKHEAGKYGDGSGNVYADLDIPTFLRRKPRVTQAFEAEQRERGEADAVAVFIYDVRAALMRYEGTFALKGVKA